MMVVREMLAYKSSHEVIAMVIAFVKPEIDGLAIFITGHTGHN
jgi:hypothetical protein